MAALFPRCRARAAEPGSLLPSSGRAPSLGEAPLVQAQAELLGQPRSDGEPSTALATPGAQAWGNVAMSAAVRTGDLLNPGEPDCSLSLLSHQGVRSPRVCRSSLCARPVCPRE